MIHNQLTHSLRRVRSLFGHRIRLCATGVKTRSKKFFWNLRHSRNFYASDLVLCLFFGANLVLFIATIRNDLCILEVLEILKNIQKIHVKLLPTFIQPRLASLQLFFFYYFFLSYSTKNFLFKTVIVFYFNPEIVYKNLGQRLPKIFSCASNVFFMLRER